MPESKTSPPTTSFTTSHRRLSNEQRMLIDIQESGICVPSTKGDSRSTLLVQDDIVATEDTDCITDQDSRHLGQDHSATRQQRCSARAVQTQPASEELRCGGGMFTSRILFIDSRG